MKTQPMDRVLALQCDRALAGLDPDREAELVSLMAPGARLDPRLELAAAAIALSEMTIDEHMPADVAARVLANAGKASLPPASMPRGGTVPMPGRASPVPPSLHAARELPVSNVVPIGRARRSSWIGWAVAAACLGVAAGSIVISRQPRPQIAVRLGPEVALPDAPPAPAPALTLAEKRAKLVAESTDLVRVPWSPTKDAAGQGETGEVVWSNERQEGYMTFKAVAKNDPKAIQYQLWIFDENRDERFPVDGGVFDVDTATGEVIVPIQARLRVDKPTLFAVTVEAPGGVVVSKRERIVVAAKVAG